MRTNVFSQEPAPLRPTIAGRLITAVIALVCCLILPAIASLILGMSRLTLTKENQQVTAKVERLLFFCIPWKTEQLSGITDARHEIIEGERIRRKHGERQHRKRYMDQAVIHLTSSNNQILDAALDPGIASQTQADVVHFLHDPDQIHYHQFLMANRLFGWVFGLPATLLAGFYLVCIVLACGKFILQRNGLLSSPEARSAFSPPAPQAL